MHVKKSGDGTSGADTETTAPVVDTTQNEQVTEAPPTEAATVEPAPQTLQGSGQQVSGAVNLEEGITVFRMTHDGTSNFAIFLLNQSTGEQVELLVNVIGSFTGGKAVGIEAAGPYVLDVTADSNWTVTAEQPRPASAPAAPQAFSGVGQSVPAPFMLNEGLATFKMTHDGRGNFGIFLLDAEGGLVELLVNEIGPFDGSKAVSVTGIYSQPLQESIFWTYRQTGIGR